MAWAGEAGNNLKWFQVLPSERKEVWRIARSTVKRHDLSMIYHALRHVLTGRTEKEVV